MFCSNLINYRSPHHELITNLETKIELPFKCFSSYHKNKLFKYIKAKIKNNFLESNCYLTNNGSIKEKNQKNWGFLSAENRIKSTSYRFFIDQSPVDDWKDSSFYSSYRHLLNELTYNGIKVVMISYPIVPEYHSLVQKSKIYFDIKEAFQSFSITNDSIFYLDLSNSVNDYNLFQDQDHLNDNGAKEFSKILKSRLIALNLK